MDEAQQQVIAFLRDFASYPPSVGPIEVTETHASLVFLAGALAVMDVRLLGGFPATAPAALLVRARLVALAALGGMAITGFTLFAAEASHLAVNPVFRLKLLLVAAALINVTVFEVTARRTVERPARRPRRRLSSCSTGSAAWPCTAGCRPCRSSCSAATRA